MDRHFDHAVKLLHGRRRNLPAKLKRIVWKIATEKMLCT